MKQTKLTVLEKNHLRMILNSSFYNFLDLKEIELTLNFLVSFLSSEQISFYQKKQVINLIEKLSIRNTLNKSDKKLLALLLFIDKKELLKKYENNLNFTLSILKKCFNLTKNNSKLYLFKMSLFLAFMIQFLVIKGASI